jgi:hypothetical protein
MRDVSPNPFLRQAIPPRRVDQRDPEIEHFVEEPPSLGVIQPPIPHLPRAKPEERHLQTRVAVWPLEDRRRFHPVQE